MLFSVLLPAYKSVFLKECIESILNQTITDFELIIVDDCSPHAIDEIISEFTDSRISYYKNETNIGAEHLVNNWNYCLQKANGEFFIMMGDDDRMEPNYLEEFLGLINKYPHLDVYHCRSIIINEESTAIGLTPSWPEFESVYENIWHRLMGFRLQYISDFVYRKKSFVKNGGFFYLPLAWGADDITSYIACGNKGIAHSNNPVFNYRKSQYTISNTSSYSKKIEAIILRQQWFDKFLLMPPEGEIDKIYWQNIRDMLGNKMQQMKIQEVAGFFKKRNIKHFFIVYYKRKQFLLSRKDILKAMLLSFR